MKGVLKDGSGADDLLEDKRMMMDNSSYCLIPVSDNKHAAQHKHIEPHTDKNEQPKQHANPEVDICFI